MSVLLIYAIYVKRIKKMVMQNKIKSYLDAHGITPYKFKQDTGISLQTAYGLYNNPQRIPRLPVLDKICETYRIQPGEIIEKIFD